MRITPITVGRSLATFTNGQKFIVEKLFWKDGRPWQYAKVGDPRDTAEFPNRRLTVEALEKREEKESRPGS